jgi:hypothetical protein
MVDVSLIYSMQPKNRLTRYINFSCDLYYPISKHTKHINLTISPYEVDTLKKSISIIRKGEKLVVLQDGVFDFSNSFCNPFFFDSYKLLYPSTSNVVFSFGNKEKSYIKYFNPNAVVKSYMPTFINKTIENKKTFSNSNAQFDVMITTANTAYFSDQEFDRLVNLLVNIVGKLKKSELTYCFRIFDKKIIEALKHVSIAFVNIIDVDLCSALTLTKSVITTPSTLSVEVMILDVPVATLIYRDYPLTTQTGWIMAHENDAILIVESMLKGADERMNIQRAMLTNYIEVDFPQLKATDVVTIANNVPPITDALDRFATKQLTSTWNFNIKYFIKRMLCKIKK